MLAFINSRSNYAYTNVSNINSNTTNSALANSTNSAQNPAFCGLWVHSLKTSDKVLKYGENNRVDFSEHPTVVKRGSVRTINIYAAVPDVA